MTELVLIAVCTRRRPQMLAQCLVSLQAQKALPEEVELQLLVVENDDAPLVDELVKSLQVTSPYPLHYVQEPQAGLSFARNKALSEALRLGANWLAFIDDDESAEAQWISELYRVAKAFSADAVRGPVLYHFPEGDRWAHLREGRGKGVAAEGSIVKEGATNNILIGRRLFADDALALRFDLRLNFTGGEDKLFFMQANQVGVKTVFAPSARVHETVPMSRCSLKMLWCDKARLASNAILIERDILGITSGEFFYWKLALKEFLTALKKMMKAGVSLLKNRGDARRHFLGSVLAIARVQGIFSGLRGRRHESYRQVHGH
jgi:succinoglycan biosynthesis protein ExoM